MAEQIISKTCRICKEIKPINQFYKNAPSKDGHQGECKICHLKYDKKYRQTERGKIACCQSTHRYRQTEKGKITNRKGKKRYRIKHFQSCQAHHAVNNAITVGKLPRPDTLLCNYCPKPAQQYHHWHGYEPEHWLDVVPVCESCHKHLDKKTA